MTNVDPAPVVPAPSQKVPKPDRRKGLRLVRDSEQVAAPETVGPVPIAHKEDPRWIIALRVAERLEGTMIRPETRRRIEQIGRCMGMTPFDCSLIIAIVQDQARRGHKPMDCPTAGRKLLEMIPPPRKSPAARAIPVSWWVGALAGMELSAVTAFVLVGT